jgi:hypothetical protein
MDFPSFLVGLGYEPGLLWTLGVFIGAATRQVGECDAARRSAATGHCFNFLACEFAGAHAVEHSVLILVCHLFLLFLLFIRTAYSLWPEWAVAELPRGIGSGEGMIRVCVAAAITIA